MARVTLSNSLYYIRVCSYSILLGIVLNPTEVKGVREDESCGVRKRDSFHFAQNNGTLARPALHQFHGSIAILHKNACIIAES